MSSSATDSGDSEPPSVQKTGYQAVLGSRSVPSQSPAHSASGLCSSHCLSTTHTTTVTTPCTQHTPMYVCTYVHTHTPTGISTPPTCTMDTRQLSQDLSQETYEGLLVSRMANLTRDTLQLPPLRKKVQGPFRAPEEVLRQRYKPLQPTLRVATAYDSVEAARHELRQEEWRGRVVEERWVGCWVRSGGGG